MNPSALLEAGEPPPVEIFQPEGTSRTVLVCDHATNRMPKRLGSLGLSREHLLTHIAWDSGAAAVARRLAVLLDAPLVLSGYSRLVIDCNRQPGSRGSIPEESAGVVVPGNQGLSDDDRTAREHLFFSAYHDAIDRLLDARLHRRTILLAIHSFTPVLGDGPRPWHVGVCSGRDRRLAESILVDLTRASNLCVGDNQPYAIEDDVDYTLPVHGEGRGLPHAMLELRQDELSTPAQHHDWAARLAECCRSAETRV